MADQCQIFPFEEAKRRRLTCPLCGQLAARVRKLPDGSRLYAHETSSITRNCFLNTEAVLRAFLDGKIDFYGASK